jgi:hypothetical protein
VARESVGQVEQTFVDVDTETGQVVLRQEGPEQVFDRTHAEALGRMLINGAAYLES